MKNIKRILAPTDFSSLSALGVSYALDLGRSWGAVATVYNVAEAAELASYRARSLDDLLERNTKLLSEFLAENFAGLLPVVEIRQKVAIGAAADSILMEAEQDRTDLIVMSTHGRTGLSHFLMGSVTEKVVRNAPCLVFSVHQPRAGK
jgi:nucleotide-binding universal stress UspA family protein